MRVTQQISILALEDDAFWQERLREVAESQGWYFEAVDSLDALVHRAATNPVSLVLIDRMLGEGTEDGVSALAKLHSLEIPVPVIVVSALSASHDQIDGLDAGADDYVTKPFDPDQLAARMRSVLRRRGLGGGYPAIRLIGDLEVRISSRTATRAGKTISPPEQAFTLLELLTENPENTVSRGEIWSRGWPHMRRLEPQDQVIDAAISRLRKALATIGAGGMIINERGLGYGIRPA